MACASSRSLSSVVAAGHGCGSPMRAVGRGGGCAPRARRSLSRRSARGGVTRRSFAFSTALHLACVSSFGSVTHTRASLVVPTRVPGWQKEVERSRGQRWSEQSGELEPRPSPRVRDDCPRARDHRAPARRCLRGGACVLRAKVPGARCTPCTCQQPAECAWCHRAAHALRPTAPLRRSACVSLRTVRLA
jgi:hypothetical protein